MEKPKKTQKCPPRKAWEYAKDVYMDMPAVSATDFTGFAPIVPETEYDAQAYCDVMDAPVTAKDGAGKYKKYR